MRWGSLGIQFSIQRRVVAINVNVSNDGEYRKFPTISKYAAFEPGGFDVSGSKADVETWLAAQGVDCEHPRTSRRGYVMTVSGGAELFFNSSDPAAHLTILSAVDHSSLSE